MTESDSSQVENSKGKRKQTTNKKVLDSLREK